MKKVIVLGKSGMLGSKVFETFVAEKNINVFGTDRSILDAQTVTTEKIESIIDGFDYIINCIGIIKPYIHDDNSFEVQRAILVNGLFPHKLAAAAEKVGAKIIQIATDCVFDGVKGGYTENDKHNPTDVYGKTKSLGEVVSPNVLNLRCSIIGKELKGKTSLLEWFINQPKNGIVKGFKNHLWNGVTTDAFAKLCLGIIKKEVWFSGLQHIVPSSIMSKAEMLKLFAEVFNRKDIIIEDINADISIDRTISTINNVANSRLWKIADYEWIPTVEEMIKEIKQCEDLIRG